MRFNVLAFACPITGRTYSTKMNNNSHLHYKYLVLVRYASDKLGLSPSRCEFSRDGPNE